MAAKLIASLLLFLTSAAISSAQSQRNIQVQFPSLPAPSSQIPPTLRPPSPEPALAPASNSALPRSCRSKVRVAVAVTAASSIALCALLFSAFLFLARRLQVRVADVALPERGSSSPKLQPASSLDVDENGLEPIYWREFREVRCPFCRNQWDASDLVGEGDGGGGPGGGAADGSPSSPGRRRRIQERPLLPAGSISSSQSISSVRSAPSQLSYFAAAIAPSARSAKHSSFSHHESVPRRPRRLSSTSSVFSPAPSLSVPLPPPTITSSVASASTHSPPLPPQPLTTTKSSAVPAPPPPPPVAKSIPAAPPPPPPPRKTPPAAPSRPSLPPPAPPTGGGRTASSPSGRPPPVRPVSSAAAVPDDGSTKKLKPLHWDKMNPENAQHSMVWDQITNGSFRFDEDILEVLFGTMATHRKSSAAGGRASAASGDSGPSMPTATISLLDQRRSQNIAIVLRSLSLNRSEILEALVEGPGLPADVLERLTKVAPTEEEEALIRSYDGNPAKLAEAESFLFHIFRAVPSPFARFDAMLFRANYEHEVAQLRQSLQTMKAACKELKMRGLLLKLLEAVLKAGNLMNAGTARGNAQAFNLSALCKLSDVKSTDGSTTLLHFVVEEVVRSEGKRLVLNRNHSHGPTTLDRTTSRGGAGTREEREVEYIKLGLPVVGGISDEFASVKKAAGFDPDSLAGTCASLAARLAEIKQFLDSCGAGDGFTREMRAFVETAEEELRATREEQGRVMELVRGVTEYYHPGTSRTNGAHPLRLFVTVRDFLNMVDKACVDIARNLQKKNKPPAESSVGRSSARDRKPVARFPHLPPNFLSRNVRSDSSSDDEDAA